MKIDLGLQGRELADRGADRRPFNGSIARVGVGLLVAGGLGYFIFTASRTALLIAGAVVFALIALFVWAILAAAEYDMPWR